MTSGDYPLPHYEWAIRSTFGFDGALELCHQIMGLEVPSAFNQSGLLTSDIAAAVVTKDLASRAGMAYDEPSKIETHCMLEFEKWGHQVFCLPKIMQEKFDNTDVDRIGIEELDRLPYGCFYVNLRDCDRICHGTEDGKPYKLSGFYVMRFQQTLYRDAMGNERTIDRVKKHQPHVAGVGKDALTILLHAEGEDGAFGSKSYIVLDLKRCFTRFDCVNDYINFLHGNKKHEDSTPGIVVDVPNQRENHMWAYRVFAGLLTYLNTQSPEIRTTGRAAKRRQIQRKLNGETNKKTITKLRRRLMHLSSTRSFVGESIEQEVISRPGFSWEKKRSWRRGHDHRFWIGPKKYPDGREIPFSEWTTAAYPEGHPREGELIRELATKWVQPTIINPDKEPPAGCREYWFSLSHRQKHAAIRKAFKEGRLKEVKLNTYERNPSARAACLEYYGCVCQVCEYDPAKDHKLGHLVARYVQVHHRKPLHEIGKEYVIDPVNDLVPVCYLCHQCIHSRGTKKPPYTIDELRDIISQLEMEQADDSIEAA